MSQENYEQIKKNAIYLFQNQKFDVNEDSSAVLLKGSMLSWVTSAVLVASIEFFDTVYYEKDGSRICFYSRMSA